MDCNNKAARYVCHFMHSFVFYVEKFMAPIILVAKMKFSLKAAII